MAEDNRIVTFGIPLLSRTAAPDWERTVYQLSATIGSIFNQDDPNFRIILACSERPELSVETDGRLECLDLPDHGKPASFVKANSDAGRRRRATARRLGELGGGYLILADADDLISSGFVSFIRQQNHPNGYLVTRGLILDAETGSLAPFPLDGIETGSFDKVCGTCAVVRYAAEELPDDENRKGCLFDQIQYKGHAEVGENMARSGRPLMEFPFPAVTYVRNTGENLSGRRVDLDDHVHISRNRPLLDATATQRLNRTPQIDAEFNIRAAITPSDQTHFAKAPDTTTVPRLSVAIITHKRPFGLKRLLTALRPQVENRTDREVIIVNDGSHDDDYADVAAEFADIITYRELPENVGIVSARNASVDGASGDYIVFTDDDCEPPQWWLDWLEARLDTHPELDVVAGPTKPLWPDAKTFTARVQAHYSLIPHPWQSGSKSLFVTANLAVRRSLFFDVGGFRIADANTGVGEDTELSVRLGKAGARSLIDWHWYVRHEVGGRLSNHAKRYWRYGYANVSMCRLLSAPDVYADLQGADRRNHIGNAIRQFRESREKSEGFSDSRIVRALSALAVTYVHCAYYDGCAKAAALRRKEISAGQL